MKRNLITLLVAGIAIAVCSCGQHSTSAAVVSVSADAFAAQMDSGPYVLLDVRTPDEFRAGHIDSAINIDVNAADFSEKIRALPAGRTILVYCRSGKRSLTAANMLTKAGFAKVYNLKGGYLEWTTTEK